MKKILLSFVLMIIISFITTQCNTTGKAKRIKSADSTEISFKIDGDGEIPLIFVHGWCCDKTYWKNQIPEFSKRYRVITIDLGGHGESGMSRKKWTIESFGQDVVAVIKHLKLKRVILIGHSMGGMVIVETAKQVQEKIIGLIGIDTLGTVEQKYTREQFEFFIAPVRKDFKKGTENFLRFMMFTPRTDKNLIEEIVKDMCDCPPEVGLGAWDSMFVYDLPEAMDQANAHIRCINCDKYPLDEEAGKRHSASFKFKIMKGLGHFVMMEDPEAFNKLLEETIQELIKKGKQAKINKRSYQLGIIAGFSEDVSLGIKKLALSSPLSPEEMDQLMDDALNIAKKNNVSIYLEKDFLTTDLFPESITQGKYVLLIFTGKVKDKYMSLKREKEKLIKSGEYTGELRAAIAREMGRLLSYPEEKITELLSRKNI